MECDCNGRGTLYPGAKYARKNVKSCIDLEGGAADTKGVVSGIDLQSTAVCMSKQKKKKGYILRNAELGMSPQAG